MRPSQNFHVLRGELKRSCFKADIPRCIAQNESEVDVDKVPITINENISIVPILDLQQVCYNRVP